MLVTYLMLLSWLQRQQHYSKMLRLRPPWFLVAPHLPRYTHFSVAVAYFRAASALRICKSACYQSEHVSDLAIDPCVSGSAVTEQA